MSTVFNHAAAFCHKLPEHVSLDEGALFEPMCVGLHAVTRARVAMGDSVLITGAGPIGLLLAMCAKAAGAASVTITDMVDAKLAKAKEVGVDCGIKANTPNIVDVAVARNGGERFDKCFECCGVPSALDLCVKGCASGGVVCVVANLKERTSTLLQEAARREVDIIGVYRYCNLYPTALALVASGKVALKPLISRRFPLAQCNEAFAYFATGEPIKVIIEPTPSVCPVAK